MTENSVCSADTSSARVCIICDHAYRGHQQIEGGHWPSLSSGAGAPRLLTTRGSRRGENLQLNSQLPVILLVRKILRIPTQFLESLLRDCGDPSQWGIDLCRACMGVFKKAEVVHSKISKLIEEFEGLADKLREELRESDRRRRKNRGKDQTPRKTNKDELIGNVTNKTSVSLDLRREFLSKSKGTCVRNQPQTGEPQDINEGSRVNSQTTPDPDYNDFSRIGKVEFDEEDDLMDHDDSSSLHFFEEAAETAAEEQSEFQSIPQLLEFKVDLKKGDLSKSENVDLTGGHKQSKTDLDNINNDDDPLRDDRFPLQPSDSSEGFYCEICPKRNGRKGRSYETKDILESHKRKVHQNIAKPFECKLCGKFFAYNYLRRRHMVTHSKSKNKINRPKSENVEENLKGGDKESKTDLDNISNDDDKSNDHDTMKDNGLIPSQPSDGSEGFCCYICPKPHWRTRRRYKTEDMLEAHKRQVHQNMAKPFECKLCGKFFAYNYLRRRHMLTHSNSKNKIRPNLEDVEENLKGGHPELKPDLDNINNDDDHDTMNDDRLIPSQPSKGFYCYTCPKPYGRKRRLYKTEDMLESHKRQVHQRMAKPFECKFCKKFFPYNYLLRRHTLTKSHRRLKNKIKRNLPILEDNEENLKGEGLKTNSDNLSHDDDKSYCDDTINDDGLSRSQPSEGFCCYICPKPYGRKRRLYKTEEMLESHKRQVHQRMAKPFECKLCKKFFPYNYLLRRHTLTKSHRRLKNRSKRNPTNSEDVEKDLTGSHEDLKTDLDNISHNDDRSDGDDTINDDGLSRSQPSEGLYCYICPKPYGRKRRLYKTEDMLESHKRQVHQRMAKPFECKLCGKFFPYNYLRRRHMVTHSKSKNKANGPNSDKDLNGGSKESKTDLDNINNDDDKSGGEGTMKDDKLIPSQPSEGFYCYICPKPYGRKRRLYKTEDMLESHNRQIHQNMEKPFECKVCGKFFAYHYLRRKHMLTHTKSKNKIKKPNSENVEEDLNKGSKESKTDLDNNDVEVDTSDDDDAMKDDGLIPSQPSKGFYCYICPKPYGRKRRLYKTEDMLESHKKQVHQRMAKRFECKLCRMFFSYKYLLGRHRLTLTHRKLKKKIQRNNPNSEDVEEDDGLVPSEPSNSSEGFYCDICPKPYGRKRRLYNTEDMLESHKRQIHQNMAKPFECKQCGKFFSYYYLLRNHMKAHPRMENRLKRRNERPFCKECNQEFKSMRGLVIHMQTRRHLPPGSTPKKKKLDASNLYRYECLECDRKFKSREGFKTHMTVSKYHNHEMKFQCEFCSKGFYHKAGLENHHARDHHAELNIEPFQCTFCNKTFASKRNLRNHVGVQHTKNTRFKCSECNMGFMVSSTYKKHVAVVHAKEKLFQCTDCPKRFSNSGHLNIHMRVHSGEKPLKCKDCGKEFADPPTFNRHRETHGDTTYTCAVCRKQFKVWHSYRIHMKRHNQHIFKVSTQNMPTRESDNSNLDSTPAPGSETSTTASSLR